MDLQAERQQLIAQRDNAFAVYHQAVGAIQLIDHLIAQQEQPALTLPELKEALGAAEIGEPEKL